MKKCFETFVRVKSKSRWTLSRQSYKHLGWPELLSDVLTEYREIVWTEFYLVSIYARILYSAEYQPSCVRLYNIMLLLYY